MANELIKTNFSLPSWDAKKISRVFMACVILGGLAFLFYVYILPFLLKVVWGTVQLVIGAVVAFFLLMILTNKKFWRGLGYFAEAIAQWTLGFAIEMNPWNILYSQVEHSEKDRAELYKQGEKLKAQDSKLTSQLDDNDKLMRQSEAEIKICKARLAKTPNDLDAQLALETSSTNFNNAKDFIDGVKPVSNDIKKLVDFADKAYRKSGVALQNAKSTITIQKAKYDAVTTASVAMNKALRAFTGNTDLNNDADQALEKLRKDVAEKIGGIKSAIQITSQIMDKQDLHDAAKVSLAVDTAEQMDVDKTFTYSSTVQSSATQIDDLNTSGGNKYMDFLKK
jgi:hypothetical protein